MIKDLKKSTSSNELAKELLFNIYIRNNERKGIHKVPTKEEINELFNDPYFLEIKKLCKKNPNLIYLFTKIFFDDLGKQWEGESEEVKKSVFGDVLNLYNSLMEKKTSWTELPMPIDRYALVKPTESDKRTSFERLSDDWRDLGVTININKFIKRLLPFQREFIDMNNPLIKNKIEYIANSFASFGKKSDGTIDQSKNKQLQDEFFVKYDLRQDGKNTILKRIDYIARYRNLKDLLEGAISHIESSSKSSYLDRLELINEANQKLGVENGAEILYMEKGIMVIEVKSFQANRIINSNTSHCIKDSLSSWDWYLSPDKYRKQFYIYNFNIPFSDKHSVIGLTMADSGKIVSCHLKNDNNFLELFDYYNKKTLQIPDGVMVPLKENEKISRRKKLSSNKIIINPDSTIEEIREAIENGGNVNENNGEALSLSLRKNDYKRVKFLIEMGARTDLRTDLLHNPNLSLEIICLLLSSGAVVDIVGYLTIKKMIDNGYGQIDTNKLEKILSSGMSPDILDGILIRESIQDKKLEALRILTRFGADYGARSYLCVYSLMVQGKGMAENFGDFNTDIVDEVFDTLRKQKDEFFVKKDIHRSFIINKVIGDYPMSDGKDEEKAKRASYIIDKIFQGDREDYLWLKKEINISIDKEKSALALRKKQTSPRLRFLETWLESFKH